MHVSVSCAKGERSNVEEGTPKIEENPQGVLSTVVEEPGICHRGATTFTDDVRERELSVLAFPPPSKGTVSAVETGTRGFVISFVVVPPRYLLSLTLTLVRYGTESGIIMGSIGQYHVPENPEKIPETQNAGTTRHWTLGIGHRVVGCTGHLTLSERHLSNVPSFQKARYGTLPYATHENNTDTPSSKKEMQKKKRFKKETCSKITTLFRPQGI